MKTLLPLALAAVFLAGCAAIERAEKNSTEQLLSAAGFRILPADTPQKQANITLLNPKPNISKCYMRQLVVV
jgi:hypothetical protein